MKPNLFIGSSVEKLPYAYALRDQLKDNANIQIWDQDVFTPNTSYLDSLIAELSESDFGIFLFLPDDMLKLRAKNLESVRDNVLFEFGLFMGRLGKERAFFIMPHASGKLRIPSDLLGISTITFDVSEQNERKALRSAVSKIRKAIEKFGVRQERLDGPIVDVIPRPKILCACSPQYFHLSFPKDVELIKKETEKISAEVKQMHNVNSTELMNVLLENTFDLIHISAYVSPKTGEIYFNDINENGVPVEGVKVDSIQAESFAKLIEIARVRLVILATCDSLLLGAKLARITNMIAATDSVGIDDILQWELALYKCLSKGISLSNAYETASISKAPMLLLLKKNLAFIG